LNTITAIVSDTHIGSTVGLALPQFENGEGQLISASREQGWIYQNWLEYWEHVRALTRKHRARLIAIHLGDIVDGNHHASVQLLPDVVDQENMAHEILEPISHKAAKIYICRGTEAHVGPSAGSEVRIAARLGAEIVWEELLEVDGVILDLAHHGRAGRRPWTSAAAGMATEAQINALRKGKPVPRYVLRGHNHLIDDSGDKVEGTRAIAMPSWQLKTAFGHRVAPGSRSDIGGLIMLPDGSLDLSRMRYKAAPDEGGVIHV
jgi:hypothetical protein